MSDQKTYDAMTSATLILAVDAARVAGDPFKFTTTFAALGTSRLSDCVTANAAAEFAASDTTGAGQRIGQAVERLAALARNVFNFIGSVDDETLPDADRAQVYAAYLFPGGELGNLRDKDRVVSIAQKISAIAASPPPDLPAAGLAPAATVARVNNWLAIYNGNVGIANGGTRETLIDTRNTARDTLEDWNARARRTYTSATDDGEYTKELKKINMQPRRMPGKAQPEPLPGAPGAVTYDSATRTLTITGGLPQHATSAVAYRQPAGGTPVEAGVSIDGTVSLVQFEPLDPTVSYSAWIEPANSRGHGPKSNVINFTA